MKWINKPFAPLMPDDINEYIDDRGQEVLPSTVDRKLDIFSSVCNLAINTRRIHVAQSPMHGVRRPRYFNERDRRVSHHEEAVLMQHAIEEDRNWSVQLRHEELMAEPRAQAELACTVYAPKATATCACCCAMPSCLRTAWPGRAMPRWGGLAGEPWPGTAATGQCLDDTSMHRPRDPVVALQAAGLPGDLRAPDPGKRITFSGRLAGCAGTLAAGAGAAINSPMITPLRLPRRRNPRWMVCLSRDANASSSRFAMRSAHRCDVRVFCKALVDQLCTLDISRFRTPLYALKKSMCVTHGKIQR